MVISDQRPLGFADGFRLLKVWALLANTEKVSESKAKKGKSQLAFSTVFENSPKNTVSTLGF